MDVTLTFDALRVTARSGQAFPRWWCLSDSIEQEQVRAYCRAYQPFYRHDIGGSTLTCQVLSFNLPKPSSPNVTEASCNAIGHMMLSQLGPWGAYA